ncbi:MAG TPA: carbamate kinase [Mycobacteriales bacterium]|jgi:carbamate kinase|nr:carbamate kinase [Mycobacteriales bacterium]
MTPQRVVVALGGNALSPSGGTGDVHEMRAALEATAESLADLVEQGVSLVVTHGNGPQVGRILLQQEYAAAQVPPMPMDVCGAQSQGQIGYLLAQTLDGAMARRGLSARALCLVTQVVVDGRDPAFRRPTKPVGPAYDRAGARQIAHQTGYVFRVMPDSRWRRVVPSPAPLRIVEAEPLRQIVEAGHVVVAAGGGGVPVVELEGAFHGVEAVIDKDLTAARLALLIDADQLVILTEISRVQIGFGTPSARDLTRLTAAAAESLLEAGEFPDGSMGPKVRACVDFVTAGGRRAVIGSLGAARDVVFGDAGTVFVALGSESG